MLESCQKEAAMWSLEVINEINQAAAKQVEEGLQQRETLRRFLVRDGVPRWYMETAPQKNPEDDTQ